MRDHDDRHMHDLPQPADRDGDRPDLSLPERHLSGGGEAERVVSSGPPLMAKGDLITVHYYRDGTAQVSCSCGFESTWLNTERYVSLESMGHQRACWKRTEGNRYG